MEPATNQLRLSGSGSNKDIYPRTLTQYELKIKEVEQKIKDIAQKFVVDICQKKSISNSGLLTLHHMVHQLADKAKVAKKISKEEPNFKKYRELYKRTIKLSYDQAAEKMITAVKERDYDNESDKIYTEAKEILQAIHLLK